MNKNLDARARGAQSARVERADRDDGPVHIDHRRARLAVAAVAVEGGAAIAARVEPELSTLLVNGSWFGTGVRYTFAGAVVGAQLLAFHLWLAAGKRRLKDVWPGVLFSMVMWLAMASLYSYYLNFSDYTRFYAGLSQLMVAMIFFQLNAVVIILGAELNRGIYELKRLGAAGMIEHHSSARAA